jgi:outer membrane receptor protein involved in Fe transport
MKRYSVLATCAATTFLCGPLGAHAQDAAGLDDVDEIVVTARKVEERLLDVPLTITAFSAEDLQQAGASSINDLAIATPGLFVSSALGSRSSDRIALRGVSAVAGTAGFVGIYVDGVYLPSSFAQSLELSNVQRIEVLKGPQSALFGRATLSGAINYVTRRPGDEWEGRANASFGEYGQYDVSASAGGGISDGWSLLIGARKYSRDSTYFNQLTQTKDVGGQESTSATLGLRWKPSENFDAYLRVLLSNDDDEAPAAYLQNSLFNNCLPATPGGTPLYYCGEVVPNANAIRYTTSNSAVSAPFVGTFQDDGKAGLDRDSGRAALQLEWDLGGVVLSSITSYGRDKVRDGTDLTTRAAFAYGPTVAMLPSITFDRDVKFEDYSQEIRASSDSSGRWSWLAGAYYYHEDRTESTPYRTGPASFAGTRTSENYAIFGRLQFNPTDRLSLAAEGRWQNDKIQLVNKFLTNNIDISVETDSFLPRFTADYEIAEDLMVYAVASKGTKPASINTAPELANCPERQKTNEEEAENLELGLKGRLFDRRLTFQAAVYKIDWNEQEYAGILQPGDCGNNTAIIRFTANAGETTIEGIELEATAIVIPDWFDVRLAYSINDTQIDVGRATTSTEALEGIRAFGTAGFTPLCAPVAGTPFAGCPAGQSLQGGDFVGLGTSWPAQAEYQLSLTANVGHQLGGTGFDWFFRADYARASKQYESIYNLAYVGPSENVNLRLGIRSENFEAAIWGRNVTDDETPTALIRSVAFADDDGAGPRNASSRAYTVYLPMPRQFGVSLSYKF